MSFGMGALILFGLAFSGYLIPIFVLDIFAIIFSVITLTLDFFNFLFEVIRPFCLGGISVGLVAGAFNYYKHPLNP